MSRKDCPNHPTNLLFPLASPPLQRPHHSHGTSQSCPTPLSLPNPDTSDASPNPNHCLVHLLCPGAEGQHLHWALSTAASCLLGRPCPFPGIHLLTTYTMKSRVRGWAHSHSHALYPTTPASPLAGSGPAASAQLQPLSCLRGHRPLPFQASVPAALSPHCKWMFSLLLCLQSIWLSSRSCKKLTPPASKTTTSKQLQMDSS